MTPIPSSHITDAHKLDADGKVTLYELTPSIGTGVLRFKESDTYTYRGQEFLGIPLTFEGEVFSSQGVAPQPSLVIGEQNVDLSVFKPLIWSGGLDNARIVRYKILLDDLLNNRDISIKTAYRVKRVDGYSSTQIKMSLSTFSPTGPSSLPFRQFIPPDFPFVVLQ